MQGRGEGLGGRGGTARWEGGGGARWEGTLVGGREGLGGRGGGARWEGGEGLGGRGPWWEASAAVRTWLRGAPGGREGRWDLIQATRFPLHLAPLPPLHRTPPVVTSHCSSLMAIVVSTNCWTSCLGMHILSYMSKFTRILFHLAALCDSLRCGAYGTYCYGIS